MLYLWQEVNKMKKILSVIMTFALMLSCSVSVFADIGDVAGNIYSTDIVAYIDGMAIPSYNIGGQTAVIAEELIDYGFSVVWNEERRVLVINSVGMPEKLPEYKPEKTRNIGKKVGNIYESDISVYLNGAETQSFNIGGKTAIIIENIGSLDYKKAPYYNVGTGIDYKDIGYNMRFMRADWDSEKREIYLYRLKKGDKINTKFGEMTVDFTQYTANTPNGAWAYYKNGNNQVVKIRNVSTFSLKDDVYMSVDSYLLGDDEYVTPFPWDIDISDIELKDGNFNISVEKDVPTVMYKQIGGRNRTAPIVFLKEKLCVNGKLSETEGTDLILYGDDVCVGLNALNSAFADKIEFLEYDIDYDTEV